MSGAIPLLQWYVLSHGQADLYFYGYQHMNNGQFVILGITQCCTIFGKRTPKTMFVVTRMQL
jgi:hypothetical protein